MKKFRKLILVDLDGVLNQYNGEYNPNTISPIKEGAKEFLEELSKNCIIKIFTTRDKFLTQKWLNENNLNKYEITNTKESAYLIIDDRCICFNGDYNKTLEQIKTFKAYWKH